MKKITVLCCATILFSSFNVLYGAQSDEAAKAKKQAIFSGIAGAILGIGSGCCFYGRHRLLQKLEANNLSEKERKSLEKNANLCKYFGLGLGGCAGLSLLFSLGNSLVSAGISLPAWLLTALALGGQGPSGVGGGHGGGPIPPHRINPTVPALPAINPKQNVLMPDGRSIDYFSTILGVSEDAFRSMSRQDRTLFVDARKRQTGIGLGNFMTYSIAQLRQATNNVQPFAGQGYFRVLVDPNIDVKTLQADPAYADAVFQVASNFNCLEGRSWVGDEGSTGNRLLLNHWQDAPAQGEQAAMSAFPGAVLRRYLHDRVNLLDALVAQNLVTMQYNGRRVANVLGPLTNGTYAINEPYAAIKVGYHGDISVTHGQNKQNVVARRQKINQVFTAALDLRGASNDLLQAAPHFLQASYEGTILAALRHRKQKVVLTIMGAGVFCGNDRALRTRVTQDVAAVIGVGSRLRDIITRNNMQVTVVWRGRRHAGNQRFFDIVGGGVVEQVTT